MWWKIQSGCRRKWSPSLLVTQTQNLQILQFLSWWWINNIVLLYRLCGVINTGGGVSIQVAYINSWRLVQCWRLFARAWAPASPILLDPTLYVNNNTYYHNSWYRIHVTNGCIRIVNVVITHGALTIFGPSTFFYCWLSRYVQSKCTLAWD